MRPLTLFRSKLVFDSTGAMIAPYFSYLNLEGLEGKDVRLEFVILCCLICPNVTLIISSSVTENLRIMEDRSANMCSEFVRASVSQGRIAIG